MTDRQHTIQASPKKRPCVCLGDVSELIGPASKFSEAMPTDYIQRHNLRKWWEWEYIAECADLCGHLHETQRAVGLGVGCEPLTFYFSRFCRSVLATDLYSTHTIWKEARVDDCEAIYSSSPITFPRERVEVKNADMRSLPIPDGGVDFAWSCSSIEHVPTLKDLLDVFRELARVLRIGGHAILTTEFCLTDAPYILPGVNALDVQLFQKMIIATDAFEIVGQVNLDYNWAHPGNSARPRRYVPPGMVKTPHTGFVEAFRCGQMGNLVGISFITPIAFVLRRKNGAVPAWDDLDLPQVVRDFTAAVLAVQERKVDGVCAMLDPYVQAGPGTISLQLYMLIFRYYIEAMAIGPHSRPEMHKKLEAFLNVLPPGDLQDGDCLDLVAYLLSECGDHANSAHVYRLALASPSTISDHAIRLSHDYLRVMARSGQWNEGSEFVIELYKDLLLAGSGIEGIEGSWDEGMRRARQSTYKAWSLKGRLDRKMDQASTEFRQAIGTRRAIEKLLGRRVLG